MPPRVMTQSAGRPAVVSLGGGTGVRVGKGGRGRRPREGNDERVDDLNGQGNNQGCSYKEFLACNRKEYDGKGCTVVLTRWIEKMESVQDMSGCSNEQKVKYIAGLFVEFCPSHEMQKLETELWNHDMVGAGHAAYTDRFHELARMVAVTEPKTMQKAVQIYGALTDEAVRNGSIKKVEKRKNVEEPSKEERMRALGLNVQPEILTIHLKGLVAHASTKPPVKACYECGSTDHVRSVCPRLNRAQGPGGNRPNQVISNNGGQGRGNQENQARGRAFMLGAGRKLARI
uniref:CCHC-type domain-containing protein n=1 Tax=Tanacetum cinerariifolium TaxID=118510 RepID=A0A6L2N4M6_TANCI|nr:hypothetical protein [Tanacetum cinerariifolium]